MATTKKLDPSKVKYIVVHCSATSPKADIGAAEITRWHRERNFLTIGYHFVIRRSGEVEKGRELDQVGAHAEGYNSASVAICLAGGVDAKNKPEDNFTLDQKASLAELIGELRLKFPLAAVIGHRDLPGVRKACPSFDVRKWVKETIDHVDVD